MTLSDKDLFLAILAMDPYNRGYGAGLRDESLGETGEIANVQILGRQALPVTDAQYATWQAAGFYAVAYNTQCGQVVSYRGTDFTPAGELGTDAHDGWTFGGGNSFAELTSVGCATAHHARPPLCANGALKHTLRNWPHCQP
jgi:hypothetical protein